MNTSPVRAELVEALPFFQAVETKDSPSTSSGQTGLFSDTAIRLAGLAGVMFGWSPEAFWRATPAELGALVRVVAGEEAAPPDAVTVARLREAFPDG